MFPLTNLPSLCQVCVKKPFTFYERTKNLNIVGYVSPLRETLFANTSDLVLEGSFWAQINFVWILGISQYLMDGL